MSTALIGRLAEHLVCVKLTRLNLLATTLSHNVPKFDVLVTDDLCRTVPVQVKASSEGSWRFDAKKWMEIRFDKTKQTQSIVGEKPTNTPDLIWVCVVVANPKEDEQPERYFILTEGEIQRIFVSNVRLEIEKNGGHKKKNWESTDYWYNTEDLTDYENKWETILNRFELNQPSEQ